MVWPCERFHTYLFGTNFELLTDHKPLEFIYSPKSKPSARLERWVLRLQPYRYKVRYIPGKDNVSDALSRLTKSHGVIDKNFQDDVEEYVHTIAIESTPEAVTTKEIERESDRDIELKEIREKMLNGQWHNLSFKEYLPVKSELCAIGKLVLRGTRIVVPCSLWEKILHLAHEGHPGIVAMKRRLRSKVWWPSIDKQVEKHCKNCYGCQLVAQAERPEPLLRTTLPTLPWQHLAADLLGPLPSDESILVVDYYSRFFEIEITKVTTSERITSLLERIFTTHGLPLSI